MTKPDLMAELADKWDAMAADARKKGEHGMSNAYEDCAEELRTHHAELEAVVRDAGLLDFQERECITVRCEAADDDDVFYDAVSYHMAEPKERVIGTGTTPREALIQAMHNSAREGEV